MKSNKSFYLAVNCLLSNMDTSLLYEIASGNEDAFELLFEQQRGRLYNYMLKITKSKVVAEEIVLDVFLKLWIGRELLPEIKNMDAFLNKVAYNKALDFLKIASRKKEIHKLVAKQIEACQEQEADHKLLDSEYQSILKKALDQLSPQRRIIFTLSRMEGLTNEEIAQQLQLSRNTVRNTLHESLQSIREYLRQNNLLSMIILFT
jgi:RNA polymerase sigma-70 factor (ECF subfamily)